MDRLLRFFADHRRSLSAVLAGLAVLATIAAVRDVPDTSEVLVASHDLPSGHEVTSEDVKTARFPADGGPATVDQPEGRRVAGPMRAGEPFTDARLVDPRPTAEGEVLATVPVDPVVATTVRPGDEVDVLAVFDQHDETDRRLAEAATVIVVEQQEESVAVGVEVSPGAAQAIARAALSAQFTLVHAAT